jgi:CRISPR system Cascade subunit CasB
VTATDHPQPRWAQIARRWWEMLHDATRKDGTANPARDPAALARLRRATSPMDALEEPSVFDLYRKLGFSRHEFERRLPRVAVVAAVLAHVRADAALGSNGFRPRFADLLGRGEHPLMSALRFKRLLAATEDPDLMITFRRAVAIAGKKGIDVGDLAESLLDWSDRRRMQWAFDYYGAGSAAPKENDIASTDDKD